MKYVIFILLTCVFNLDVSGTSCKTIPSFQKEYDNATTVLLCELEEEINDSNQFNVNSIIHLKGEKRPSYKVTGTNHFSLQKKPGDTLLLFLIEDFKQFYVSECGNSNNLSNIKNNKPFYYFNEFGAVSIIDSLKSVSLKKTFEKNLLNFTLKKLLETNSDDTKQKNESSNIFLILLIAFLLCTNVVLLWKKVK